MAVEGRIAPTRTTGLRQLTVKSTIQSEGGSEFERMDEERRERRTEEGGLLDRVGTWKSELSEISVAALASSSSLRTVRDNEAVGSRVLGAEELVGEL
jgi:hypothetical protein